MKSVNENNEVFLKKFFSQELSAEFLFHSNGGLSGVISHFKKVPSFVIVIKGLYWRIDEHIKVVCFAEEKGGDFSQHVLSCFSGQIMEYTSGNECLVMKWIEVIDQVSTADSTCRDKVTLLFDRPDNVTDDELMKIHPMLNFV